MSRLISQFLIGCLRAIRPLLLGPALCYFTPSCAEFACQQLQEKSILEAIRCIIRRLISCNSFTFK